MIALVPSLADGRCGDAECESCRGEDEDFFHCVELAVQDLSTGACEGYSTLLKFFSQGTRSLPQSRRKGLAASLRCFFSPHAPLPIVSFSRFDALFPNG
jgi:hypothetical protein